MVYLIYLDNVAASFVEDEVLDIFYNTTKKYYANPNSIHKLGREENKMISDSTLRIANMLKVLKDEIIYTSGATESNNLAIKGLCLSYKNYGKHILISSLEHNSITSSVVSLERLGFEVEVIPVTDKGIVDIESLKNMLRDDTILVSVTSVDSELALRQPIEEIASILKYYPNCHFHTDATQSIGKVTIDYSNVDLITINPHKFHGLDNFGILVKKKNVRLTPLIEGGKSTTIYRAGTPSLANVLALEKALELALTNQEARYNYLKELGDMIKLHLSEYKNVSINSRENSLPSIINFSLIGEKALTILDKFEEHNIILSAKTSCCPITTPSKLVYALTKDKQKASSSIRVSLSYKTTKEEVEEFMKVFDLIYKEIYHGEV
ncbi:MAG: cysteine desulfurase [Bacilli bacterium]|jgi:cysteine desulfurase|nr:cysteine desulfurase [Bacilli bacterium]